MGADIWLGNLCVANPLWLRNNGFTYSQNGFNICSKTSLILTVSLSIYLYVYIIIYLNIYVFINMYFYQFICLYVYPPIFNYPYLYLHIDISSSVYLSIFLLSVFRFRSHTFIFQIKWTNLSLFQSDCLSVCLSITNPYVY